MAATPGRSLESHARRFYDTHRAGAKHLILQEQDHYRGQFWAAFDAFVPGTPRY